MLIVLHWHCLVHPHGIKPQLPPVMGGVLTLNYRCIVWRVHMELNHNHSPWVASVLTLNYKRVITYRNKLNKRRFIFFALTRMAKQLYFLLKYIEFVDLLMISHTGTILSRVSQIT